VDNLFGRPLLMRYIMSRIPDYKNAVVVSPDAGGAKRATKIADALGMDFALIHKVSPSFHSNEVNSIGTQTRQIPSTGTNGRHRPDASRQRNRQSRRPNRRPSRCISPSILPDFRLRVHSFWPRKCSVTLARRKSTLC